MDESFVEVEDQGFLVSGWRWRSIVFGAFPAEIAEKFGEGKTGRRLDVTDRRR
jgi:hypothetical protein